MHLVVSGIYSYFFSLMVLKNFRAVSRIPLPVTFGGKTPLFKVFSKFNLFLKQLVKIHKYEFQKAVCAAIYVPECKKQWSLILSNGMQDFLLHKQKEFKRSEGWLIYSTSKAFLQIWLWAFEWYLVWESAIYKFVEFTISRNHSSFKFTF